MFFSIIFLTYKKEPTKSELTELSNIMKKYDFGHELINCLIDFSYFKNGKLIINYIKKIAQTVSEKKLYSLDLLMPYLANTNEIK